MTHWLRGALRRRVLLLLFALLPWLAAAAAAPRVDAALQCETFGPGPQLECVVKLNRDGRPLSGVTVKLSATMPSMPMAHHVKPAVAASTGTPGEYRGRLKLEMAGAWSVQTDIEGQLREGQVRDRVARTLQVEPCSADRRCPAGALAAAVSHKH